MSWHWLSFASEHDFLGGCYVPGEDVGQALGAATLLGLNPGGEVLATGPLSDADMDENVPAGKRLRLLDRGEAEA